MIINQLQILCGILGHFSPKKVPKFRFSRFKP
uniref:Immune Mapped Protein 2 (IMP2) N-terminal domain n=1 Tax=Siphoviridae sp. ctDOT22 TaxID=2827812 RepID=A0A8S5SVT4_9CAUD|nr:MAG TPA: Immune Mapped Protein 2 (IMP2) N-terminal domain [Siphoviridae sp. ctDOT22]